MFWITHGVAVAAAAGIILIGVMYLANPRAIMPNFGLPLPEIGTSTLPWLRLKGMRDIVSGVVVFALLVWGSPWLLGIVLGIEALIPLSDMTLVLTNSGDANRAFLVHGSTALLMLVAAAVLVAGAA